MVREDGVRADTVWSCMQCNACVEACPVGIEQAPIINQLRRRLVEEGELPANLQATLQTIHKSGNSFGERNRKRGRWTEELDFEVKDARKEPVDVLWFVGDYASFDPRSQKVTPRRSRGSSTTTTSAAALSALAQPPRGRPVSSTMVERLVRMRPWLSEARRADLDAAVRVLRPKAAPPEPVPRPEIRSVMATLCDGAGAQSLFALVKRGRRFALAALLIKIEIGVADAWVTEGMSKAEADALIAEIVAGSETAEVSIGLLERRLADALATNVARDAPPPFGLLQVAEALGLGPLHPEAISPPVLVEELLAGLPEERTGTAATAAAHRASARWEQEFGTLDSWFEAGEAVEALLRPLRTRKQRTEAVLTRLLPGRRTFWAERCAWTAAVLKESAEDGDEAWIGFALVARDLAGERALDTMPLAARIAAATVEAFEHR